MPSPSQKGQNNNVAQEMRLTSATASFPTNPFTMLELQDKEIVEFYVVQERRATDFEAPELWKSSSGSATKLE